MLKIVKKNKQEKYFSKWDYPMGKKYFVLFWMSFFSSLKCNDLFSIFVADGMITVVSVNKSMKHVSLHSKFHSKRLVIANVFRWMWMHLFSVWFFFLSHTVFSEWVFCCILRKCNFGQLTMKNLLINHTQRQFFFVHNEELFFFRNELLFGKDSCFFYT